MQYVIDEAYLKLIDDVSRESVYSRVFFCE
jgi:hypothetical protein